MRKKGVIFVKNVIIYHAISNVIAKLVYNSAVQYNPFVFGSFLSKVNTFENEIKRELQNDMTYGIE